MPDPDLYYTVGLIDGEGSILLARKARKDVFRRPMVAVSSTTKALVDYLSETYGGYVCRHRKYKEHHADAFSWRVESVKAVALCKRIFPLLKEPKKARRARLIAETYEVVTKRNGKYSTEEFHAKELFEADFYGGGVGIEAES